MVVYNGDKSRLGTELDLRFNDDYNPVSGIYTLTISGNASIEKNNGTMIFCKAVSSEQPAQVSTTAKLLVAGKYY